MKTLHIKPEVLNRHISAAISAVLKELFQVSYGIRVTHISSERTELQPKGINFHFSIDVQMANDPEPVVLNEKPPVE